MDATVDQNATTEESEPGTTDSFHNKTTEEAVHRITLKYNYDLRFEISSRLPKSLIVKNIGDDYVFGRGIGSDILLNDIKMPRRFVSIVSRMKEGEAAGVEFCIKNCTDKKVIPFKIHQKDTVNIGPNEERELQNGTKFKLRDVKFTFYIEYGDLDSTKVELEVVRSDKLGADTDSSWYEQIGSARPPGVDNPRGSIQQTQAGLVFPRSIHQFPGQEPPRPDLREHVHSTHVYGNELHNYNHPFQEPYTGNTRAPAFVHGQYPRGPPDLAAGHHVTCNPPFGHRSDEALRLTVTSGRYCQPQRFVAPVVYGYPTDAHTDKAKSVFCPSPGAEVGLGFPFPPNTMVFDTSQCPVCTPSTHIQHLNQTNRKQAVVDNHNDIQQGFGEMQSQARVSVNNNMCCLQCQGVHCSQQTTCHPGPLNCWGSVPMNEVPRGPPLDSLQSDFISDFSAMRLQTAKSESPVIEQNPQNSVSEKVSTEKTDVNLNS